MWNLCGKSCNCFWFSRNSPIFQSFITQIFLSSPSLTNNITTKYRFAQISYMFRNHLQTLRARIYKYAENSMRYRDNFRRHGDVASEICIGLTKKFRHLYSTLYNELNVLKFRFLLGVADSQMAIILIGKL